MSASGYTPRPCAINENSKRGDTFASCELWVFTACVLRVIVQCCSRQSNPQGWTRWLLHRCLCLLYLVTSSALSASFLSSSSVLIPSFPLSLRHSNLVSSHPQSLSLSVSLLACVERVLRFFAPVSRMIISACLGVSLACDPLLGATSRFGSILSPPWPP